MRAMDSERSMKAAEVFLHRSRVEHDGGSSDKIAAALHLACMDSYAMLWS